MSVEVQDVGFASPIAGGPPVEVVGYRELVERMGPLHVAAAQRPSFGILFVTYGGGGFHSVDFDQVELRAGRLVFVRPGQVQQWHAGSGVDADVVLAGAELCRTAAWFSGEASHRDLDESSMTTAVDLVAALEREQRRFSADPVSVRLVADLFSALIGLFERAAPVAATSDPPPAYVAFRRAVESSLGRSRDARWFIRDLGYSERTVSRACLRVTGLTAKGVLDERIMLEAKRLLAHTDLPVGRVGQRLGFDEASNFNKFFVRQDGGLPSRFRADLRERGFGAERLK